MMTPKEEQFVMQALMLYMREPHDPMSSFESEVQRIIAKARHMYALL